MFQDSIRVRRILRDDVPELERFYRDLSPDSRQLRFHGASRGITHAAAKRFVASDHSMGDGFVAVVDGRIVGHAVLEPLAPRTEELAVAVADDTQHHGIGTLLMAAAAASARLREVLRLVAWVRADNVAMHRLLTGSHHVLRVTCEGSVTRYELALAPVHRGVAA